MSSKSNKTKTTVAAALSTPAPTSTTKAPQATKVAQAAPQVAPATATKGGSRPSSAASQTKGNAKTASQSAPTQKDVAPAAATKGGAKAQVKSAPAAQPAPVASAKGGAKAAAPQAAPASTTKGGAKAAAQAKPAPAAKKAQGVQKAKGGAKGKATPAAKKATPAPKAVAAVAAAQDTDLQDIEEQTNGKLRYFKLYYNDAVQGRYCGKKPKQAANKAFSSIIKEMRKTGNGKETDVEVAFSIRECTRNSKHKEYKYIGQRKVLKDPVKVKIENEDGSTKEIVYKYHNQLQKAPKE